MTARNLSSTEILVEWDPLPAKYIHGVLLSYQMRFTKNKANATEIISIPPNMTRHQVTGLEKYSRYVISLAAVNEIGVGVASDEVTVWTEEDGKFASFFICIVLNST